ncbi:uncharacterized protein LOC117653540 [Thrips palmi]|uniref:Uncharacterized protein LOC117653540 n=1 Tax=Thrips palmi TaxID=161013 RepID=A0A6P9AAT1_THRPL|nr:uncharacterized protein LOC117653540 [Thrips palmi]
MDMTANDITVVQFTDSELLDLPNHVDSLLKSNGHFKDDGVLLFNMCEKSGGGTSLLDLLNKYSVDLQEVKKVNPICLPKCDDFYGHITIGHNDLNVEEKSEALALFLNPLSYSVSPENCCLSVLNGLGSEELLNHFFLKELRANSETPPQYQRPSNVTTLKQRATRTRNKRIKFEEAFRSLPSDKSRCAKLLEELRSSHKKNEKDSVVFCTCWKCVYSESVLKVTEDGETVEDPVATAKYYQGKGFFYANGIEVGADNVNMISGSFSLSFLNVLSLTSHLDHFYPGVNSPFLYFGGPHSFFPVHVEDLSLFSINFLHHGHPKLWVIIPPTSVAKLHFFLSREFTSPTQGSCHNLLRHKYHLPTPNWLKRNGIPFKVVIQRQGQGVVVTPNAAHFGFNLGYNIAEAANFGTVSWIPYGIVSTTCTCLLHQAHPDLELLVQTFQPDMLSAYRNQRIPCVDNDPNFYKSIVCNTIWKEACDEGCDATATLQDESLQRGGAAQVEAPVMYLIKCPKKPSKRKLIMCSLCDTTYEGGHKKRLLDHMKSVHPQPSADEKELMQKSLLEMFPERIPKMVKKECKKCGKPVARSMKAHQSSSACIKGDP